MVRVKKEITRSDLSEKAQPKKGKERSERYLKYQRYIRSSKEFKKVRELVFERDGHKCMVCGRTPEDGIKLSCHHRDYSHLFEGGELEASTCITLCDKCHLGIHRVKSNYTWFSMDNPRNNNGGTSD